MTTLGSDITEVQEAPSFIQTFFCQMNKRLFFFPSNQPSPFYNESLPGLYPPPLRVGGRQCEGKGRKGKRNTTAKNGRREKERLDNEINLPSSLPYRRKYFKKLDSSLKN